MSTDTTPDAVDHAAAIREAIRLEIRLVGGSLQMDIALKHVAALDAARIAAEERADAAEQRADAEWERVRRLQSAFLKAESRVELWEANQDQSYDIWLQRWGLHPGDLAAAPAPARADGGTR